MKAARQDAIEVLEMHWHQLDLRPALGEVPDPGLEGQQAAVLIVLAPPWILVLMQPDLGTSLVLLPVFFAMLFAAADDTVTADASRTPPAAYAYAANAIHTASSATRKPATARHRRRNATFFQACSTTRSRRPTRAAA